ncbi:MAG: M57 family metalloprotease, partial [Deltaproteobacteria bacterium]
MPTPTSSSGTSSVGQTTALSINALNSGDKWGGATGTGVTLSYSFPWANSGTAIFSGHNGIGDYSTLNEQNATYHNRLSTTEQAAVRSALQSWANVANITFSEVPDTSTNVGDIRVAWTSATDLTSTGGQAWGWANYPNSFWPSGGDVWISTLSSGATDPDWSVGSNNFNALIHELGHALGLKHSFEDNPVLPIAQESEQYT